MPSSADRVVVRSTQEAPLPRRYGRQEARELCPAEDRLTGKPVTESNLTPHAPAHIAAVRRGNVALGRATHGCAEPGALCICSTQGQWVTATPCSRAVTGLPADGVAGVIGLVSCGCRSGSGDRGDLRPAGSQPSLARIRLMWVSTVHSAMTSRAVVCRLVSPCTMSSAIWRSRRVSGRLRSFSGSRPRGVGLQSGGDPVAAADYAGGRQRWAEFGFGLAGKLVQSGRPGRWRSRRRQLPAALEGDNRSHPQA